jgi:aminopeptidase 2
MCSTVRVLYTPERMVEVARVATQSDQIFTADDRIGLVGDAAALARAGLMDTSAVFALVEMFRGESYGAPPPQSTLMHSG